MSKVIGFKELLPAVDRQKESKKKSSRFVDMEELKRDKPRKRRRHSSHVQDNHYYKWD